MTDAIAELIARYHLGLVPQREAERLALIFERNPRDALARLARAAVHLGITGEHAERMTQAAADYGPTPATPARPLADAPANRHAGTPAGNTDCATSKGQA